VTETYEITVHEAPHSNNRGGGGSRSNKYVAAKEKKRWEGLFLVEFMVAKVRKGMTFCAVEIELHFPRPNHRDEENFRQSVVKPLADALQQGGYLPDDTSAEFKVRDLKLVEGEKPWPYGPFVRGYTKIRLEATYA
jgi:hypothetical protein